MALFCEFKETFIKLVGTAFFLLLLVFFVSQLFGFLVSALKLGYGDLLLDKLHHELLLFTYAPPLLAELTLSLLHILCGGHQSLIHGLFSRDASLVFIIRVGFLTVVRLLLPEDKIVLLVVLQVKLALLMDDVEGLEHVEGVIDAALHILELDRLRRIVLLHNKKHREVRATIL